MMDANSVFRSTAPQTPDMKKKKFDLESKIEKLEDILEERVEKEIEKLKPNNKTKAHD